MLSVTLQALTVTELEAQLKASSLQAQGPPALGRPSPPAPPPPPPFPHAAPQPPHQMHGPPPPGGAPLPPGSRLRWTLCGECTASRPA